MAQSSVDHLLHVARLMEISVITSITRLQCGPVDADTDTNINRATSSAPSAALRAVSMHGKGELTCKTCEKKPTQNRFFSLL